jgi:DNA-binding MarR family transcriptional regulator
VEPKPNGHHGASVEALFAAIYEARSLFHRMKVAAEEMHRQGELTGGRRGVLMGLYRGGPQTVPQMARARPVTRQHIQSLVNALLKDGYVELVENPAHKRSRLVRLTDHGREFVEEMNQREAEILTALGVEIEDKDLFKAAEVLSRLRKAFEGRKWKRLLKEI